MIEDADKTRTGLRGLAWRAMERTGTEDAAVRAYETLSRLRGGPEEWRNVREHDRVRLLAAGVLARDSSCLDIGAHTGLVLSTFVELAPEGRHIAYEPIPAMAEVLRRDFPGVDIRQAAVSDQRGEASFQVHRELPTRSSLRSVGYDSAETEEITVPVHRLDDDLPEDFAPALVKIDVEGAEHLALRGGLELLRRHRPLVFFEHQDHTARHYDTGAEEIFRTFTEDAGMRVFDMDGRGPYTEAGFRDVIARGSRWNFFAAG